MPYRRKSELIFPWEAAGESESDFIAEIPVRVFFAYWTRLLRAVTAGGIVILQYHHSRKPLALCVAPQTLYSVLRAWQAGLPDATHAVINAKLVSLTAALYPPTELGAFHWMSLSIRDRPARWREYVELLNESSAFALIRKRQRPYAVLVPLTLLACFQQRAETQRRWRENVLSCLSEVLSESG